MFKSAVKVSGSGSRGALGGGVEIIYTLPESVMNVDENRLLDSLDDHFPTTKQLGNSSFITISKSVIPPADSRNGQAVVPDTPLH